MLKLTMVEKLEWRKNQKDAKVIYLTRLNGSIYYINPELIQTVEATPDTVVTLVSNTKFIVKDRPQDIAERFIEYKRKALAPFVTEKSVD